MVHFCPIATTHPTCVFLSLADDTHIVGLPLDVVIVFLQLEQKFSTLKLLVQLN
jgi:hypothetical protein